MTTIDFEGKVKRQMEEHWDMAPEVFDAYRRGHIFPHNDGWAEVEFLDWEGEVAFFIEVNADDEVWNMGWVA